MPAIRPACVVLKIPRSRCSRIGMAGRLFFETAAQPEPELPLTRFSLDFGSVIPASLHLPRAENLVPGPSHLTQPAQPEKQEESYRPACSRSILTCCKQKAREKDMIDSRPTVVDLFAGAGLFSYAFRVSGCRIIRAVEIDPVAAETYARNVGFQIEVGDVSQLHPFGRCDILIAGPPCQGFSTLGARRADDPRNSLCLQVARWAKMMRPKVVVIENVAAFLESDEWQRLRRRLTGLDYEVTSFVLDAFDYGVPQLRRRSFAVACRDGMFTVPRQRRTVRTVRQAWEGLSAKPDGENHHYSPKPSEVALARMRVIPPGGDKRDVMRKAPRLAPPSWWRVSCEVTDAWGRMEWDSPCNTLRTALQNASKGRYIHPKQHRVISLREAARLHSIPDGWTFAGLPTQIARQIGNSVPPTLGRAIARSVLSVLN